MTNLVLDNGACTAKIGLSSDIEPKIVPNSVIKAKNVRTRIFIGDQIDDCKDLSGLYYLLAYQKGYLTNWDIQRQVWDHMFLKDYKLSTQDTNIILTEPHFNFISIQESINEVLFEEYQFKSIFRSNASYLTQYKSQKENRSPCSLVVDSGYSFTHIVPYYNGKKLTGSVRRINVGGKLLTNHLKEVISYRQLMVMDETYVINQCKEDVCYVSQDFNKDMETARLRGKENTIARDYVLPDYTQVKRGYMRPVEETTGKAQGSEQLIRMNNERFAIPEILFHPSDIGIHEMGIPEAIMNCVDSLPEEMRPHMLNNIHLTGGNCLLPGFQERMIKEVRSMAPDEFDVVVNMSDNPVIQAWEGGKLLADDVEYNRSCVTLKEYEEHGHEICRKRFDV